MIAVIASLVGSEEHRGENATHPLDAELIEIRGWRETPQIAADLDEKKHQDCSLCAGLSARRERVCARSQVASAMGLPLSPRQRRWASAGFRQCRRGICAGTVERVFIWSSVEGETRDLQFWLAPIWLARRWAGDPCSA
jgi:hypothetical protein